MSIENPEKIIWEWYQKEKKRFNFPWRRTRDPYRVLVSEVMLQQTQIGRVIPKYEEWMREFPTIRALARAPFPKVLKMWQGLGYNRRARYLKQAVEKVVREFGGKIPHDPRVLETLPGIGHYTARAVACFAYGRCEPFLDTNIRRVAIYFLFQVKLGTRKRSKLSLERTGDIIGDGEVIVWLEAHSPARNRREWYYALMDYGREVLGREKDNPNRKSVRYRKQSKFLGSRRYVRARIVDNLLLHPKGAREMVLRRMMEKDVFTTDYTSPLVFHRVLEILRRDDVIAYRNKKWIIAK